MVLEIANKTIIFEKGKLTFYKRNIENIFFSKNNKSLGQTLNHKNYMHLHSLYGDTHLEYHTSKLGDFLQYLKFSGDNNYSKFLNRYGDTKFCEFAINEHLSDKGLYCFIVADQIKYIGRCTDSFKKRINQGYGKIHPKNCLLMDK